MKKLILITILLISNLYFGQILTSPLKPSKNQLLSSDAYEVFQTNKFLDFKDRDTLIKIIDNKVYERTDLKNYFGYKKNWTEIENETFETYKKNEQGHKYIFRDSTMIKYYQYELAPGIRRELVTIYNLKGFITYDEKKTYYNDIPTETESTTNIFDNKNRVIKIIKRTDRRNKAENKQQIIEAIYDHNILTVKSENGTIVCKFIKDDNSIEYISKLSPRETASNFMYALAQKKFDIAKQYCTDKMIKEIEVYSNLNNQIEEVNFIEGNEKFSDNVTINDIWEITYSIINTYKYKVDFVIIKQKNGWKIDEFKIIK